jgi:hypothetical protein
MSDDDLGFFGNIDEWLHTHKILPWWAWQWYCNWYDKRLLNSIDEDFAKGEPVEVNEPELISIKDLLDGKYDE